MSRHPIELRFVALLAALALFAGVSVAQEAGYPNRPVRVIVAYPPGGPTDLIARLAAQFLTQSLGQDFFVENVSGASGVRGATRSPPRRAMATR
jgi:tripartite-type tricarboxylate transporter receptor subunit TctC